MPQEILSASTTVASSSTQPLYRRLRLHHKWTQKKLHHTSALTTSLHGRSTLLQHCTHLRPQPQIHATRRCPLRSSPSSSSGISTSCPDAACTPARRHRKEKAPAASLRRACSHLARPNRRHQHLPPNQRRRSTAATAPKPATTEPARAPDLAPLQTQMQPEPPPPRSPAPSRPPRLPSSPLCRRGPCVDLSPDRPTCRGRAALAAVPEGATATTAPAARCRASSATRLAPPRSASSPAPPASRLKPPPRDPPPPSAVRALPSGIIRRRRGREREIKEVWGRRRLGFCPSRPLERRLRTILL
ncbi:hypothetical protein BRADI_2g36534v3 [Brachypodium distachyon]|uniref:Uncharacterized protein n=1 Tax=Brachypodium distachyon TaxID=15368 RepID=A0A2K2DC51_BRADI|nr:hypothetical protein BRADI_2g36534v3 [Brachypodium distachyon]